MRHFITLSIFIYIPFSLFSEISLYLNPNDNNILEYIYKKFIEKYDDHPIKIVETTNTEGEKCP